MAELAARGALDGLGLPLDTGIARLSAAPGPPTLGLMPYRGEAQAVAAALGAALPEPGRIAALSDGEAIWAGANRWLLRGRVVMDAALRARLEAAAALTDQSDAWAGLRLEGRAAAVLARLVPVDLEPGGFSTGSVACTLLGHIACILVARDDGFEILVPRSYAATAVHDLGRAMRAVAGIAALR